MHTAPRKLPVRWFGPAGSEHISSAPNSMRAAETICINKSLTALKRVFQCMEAASTHVPYKDSLLTRVLEVGGWVGRGR